MALTSTTSSSASRKLTPIIPLPEETIDDLLYFSRTGSVDDLLETLLQTAKETGHPESEILLSCFDEYTGNGVLHMAAGNGHVELVKALIPYLLPPPPQASVEQSEPHPLTLHPNSSGNTPLHWASLNGHLETIKVLVTKLHADPTVTNTAGHDVVYEAEVNGKNKVVEWLLENCEGLLEAVGLGGGGTTAITTTAAAASATGPSPNPSTEEKGKEEGEEEKDEEEDDVVRFRLGNLGGKEGEDDEVYAGGQSRDDGTTKGKGRADSTTLGNGMTGLSI